MSSAQNTLGWQPAQAPGQAHSPRLDSALDRGLRRVPLAAATFVSKFAIPPFGAAGISVAIPLIVLAMAIGVWLKRFVLHPQRLTAYALLMALLWLTQILGHASFSLPSMLLLTVLHLPYVVTLRNVPTTDTVMAGVSLLATTIGAMGVIQYFVQFSIGPSLAFPIENFWPASFKVSAFNTQGYTEYGSDIYRTNGVVMLEPSFLSQMMAVGFIAELLSAARWHRLALMSTALLVSFSGTGLALLVVSLFFVAVAQKRWELLIALGAVGTLVVLAGSLTTIPYISPIIARAGEFTSTGSSGFARFVGGFYMFQQFLWPDTVKSLFGFGAGSFQTYSLRSNVPAAGMALFKMVFEFGLVGSLAYFSFLIQCIWTSPGSPVLRLAIALTFLLSGNYIPFAHGLAFAILVWPTPVKSAGR